MTSDGKLKIKHCSVNRYACLFIRTSELLRQYCYAYPKSIYSRKVISNSDPFDINASDPCDIIETDPCRISVSSWQP